MVTTTKEVIIPDGITIDVQEKAELAQTSLVAAQEYSITSNYEFEVADLELQDVRDRKKWLEDEKEKIFRPAKDTCDAIQDFFNPPIKACEEEIKLRRTAMLTWKEHLIALKAAEEAKLREQQRKEQERINNQVEKKAEKAEEKGNLEAADEIRSSAPVVPQQQSTIVVPKSSNIRSNVKWIPLVNIEVLKKQAPQYITELSKKDLDALAKIGKASEGKIEIPGVTWQRQV